jgi:integrase
LSVKKADNGTWMFDVRHPVTKKRKRVRGFRTRAQADQARTNQMEKWRSEKYGHDFRPNLSQLKLILRDELVAEAELLRAEFEAVDRKANEGLRKLYAQSIVRRFAEVVPATLGVADLQREHLDLFSRKLEGEGIAPNTITNYQLTVRFVLKRIAKRNTSMLPASWEPPMFTALTEVRAKGTKLRRVWSDEEFDRIVDVLLHPERHVKSERLWEVRRAWRDVADLIRIAKATGMRKTEIFLIERNRVFFQWGIMQARTLKRRGGAVEFRDIPITPELESVLRDRMGLIPPEEKLLFPRVAGKYSSSWVYDNLRKAAEHAGVEYGQASGGVVIHGLRHTAATRMVASGVDIPTAAEVLGNSIETMLENYAHTTIDSKRRAMETIAERKPTTTKDNVIQFGT